MEHSKVKVDLNLISIKEYRRLFDDDVTLQEEDAIVSKACGMTVEDFIELPQPVYRRAVFDFFRQAREPLAESDEVDRPNSAGESTSP